MPSVGFFEMVLISVVAGAVLGLGFLIPEFLTTRRKVVLVALAIASALLSPPDPVSMLIILLPLYGIFGGWTLGAYLVVRSHNSAQDVKDA